MSHPFPDVGVVEICEYLANAIGDWFSKDVSAVYFGDVGVYPPSAFKDTNNNDTAVVSIAPRYNRETSNRTAADEEREIGIEITVMVNIIPYFEAFPSAAYGEKQLASLVTRIYSFLTDIDNATLYGRVSSSKVRDIEWVNAQRGPTAVREATLIWEAKVVVHR